MFYSEDIIEQVRTENDIVDVIGDYVKLQKKGSSYFGLCPFHNEKSPSFSVSPHKQMYYCFGCGEGGNVISFLMKYENYTFIEAMEVLADRAGIELPKMEYSKEAKQEKDLKTKIIEINTEAAKYYHYLLKSERGKLAYNYLSGRKLSDETILRFGLGYSDKYSDNLYKYLKNKGYNDSELKETGLFTYDEKRGVNDKFWNRVMFPIMDANNRVIAFGGRVMGDGKPKYLNSPETLIFNKRKNLFALNYAKKSKMGYLILVEGYMDAIALHQYGFDCAVASLGTALTDDGATLLSRYTDQVVLIYDGDTAGQNATQRAIPMLEKAGLQVKVLQMRDAKDPDEFLKKFGADRFRLLLEESSNRVEYQLAAIARKYDLRDDDQKVRYLQESADLIGSLPSAVQRDVYGGRVAEAAKISADAMQMEIKRAWERRVYQEKRKQEKIDLSPARNLQPKSRDIRYTNMKSAMAEEMLLSLVLRESALLDSTGGLEAEMFSSELLGRVYAQLKQRHEQGLEVSLGGLTDLTPEEMSHIAGILHRQQGPVNEQALTDCIRTIQNEYQASKVATEDDLLAVRERMKERKGMKA